MKRFILLVGAVVALVAFSGEAWAKGGGGSQINYNSVLVAYGAFIVYLIGGFIVLEYWGTLVHAAFWPLILLSLMFAGVYYLIRYFPRLIKWVYVGMPRELVGSPKEKLHQVPVKRSGSTSPYEEVDGVVSERGFRPVHKYWTGLPPMIYQLTATETYWVKIRLASGLYTSKVWCDDKSVWEAYQVGQRVHVRYSPGLLGAVDLPKVSIAA